MVKDMFDKIIKNNKFIFLITATLFAFILNFASMFGDDLYLMHVAGNNILDYWNASVDLYTTWSSRIIVNFLIFFFTDHNLLYWAIFMGISMYVLLYAFYKLFSENSFYNLVLIIAIVMFFPFKEISTAGWIATTVTYFAPVAFGFLALIPIKKYYSNELIKPIECIVYTISLIFACNNEQVMALLLASYLVSSIYYTAINKRPILIYIQLLLTIACAAFILTCPGNTSRDISEVAKWFPSFNYYGLTTKLDICFSTTMKWLLCDNVFFPLFSLVLTYLIWNKYKTTFIRTISLVTSLILVLVNYLKDISTSIFPYFEILTKEIPYYGLFNSGDINHTEAIAVYVVWLFIIFVIIYEIIMLAESLPSLLACLTLSGAGFASRMAIAISPTIYASGFRTCAIFIFALMATLILLINKSKIDVSKFKYLLLTSIALNFINFIFIVATISA